MQTLQPLCFSLARWPCTAAISSSTDCTRRFVEYQPEIALSPTEDATYFSTIKKGLGGFGGADKDDMMAAAKRAGMHPKVHDEADAFGMWIVVMRTYAKQYQHIWDQRLYGNRRLA